MSVAAWRRVIGDSDANNGLKCAPAGLRDAHVADGATHDQIRAIRHQRDLDALPRQRPSGFRVLAVHADHQTEPHRAGAGVDVAGRKTRTAPARELGTVEVANVDLAVMQARAAGGVDEQGRVERLRLGLFQKRRDDVDLVRPGRLAKPEDKVAVKALRLCALACLGRRIVRIEGSVAVRVHLWKDDDFGPGSSGFTDNRPNVATAQILR